MEQVWYSLMHNQLFLITRLDNIQGVYHGHSELSYLIDIVVLEGNDCIYIGDL